MKVYAIKVRGMGKDMNGCDKYVWATKSQYEAIKERMNDPELRNSAVEIGEICFPISGVMFMEPRDKDYYNLPKYCLDRYKQENPNEKLLDSMSGYNPNN